MFCFKRYIHLLPSADCFSCSRSSPSSPQSAAQVVWLVTRYSLVTGSCSFSRPWQISCFACSSSCLSFASSPFSPPPPPHWATASFAQPVSKALQVHILSNRQTFQSLFIETFTLWDCCGDSTLTTAPPYWSLPPPRCSLDSTFIHYLSLIVGFRYIIEKGGWQ